LKFVLFRASSGGTAEVQAAVCTRALLNSHGRPWKRELNLRPASSITLELADIVPWSVAKWQAAQAEQVFREDLRRNPRNPGSLFGLCKALEAQKKDYEASWVRHKL
jgi:hypothetical protein